MAKPVVIRREAEKEATEAVQWYAERSKETAKRFCDELLECVNALAAEPERFPVYHGDYRYRLLKRFPYRVIYRQRDKDIEILAVAHTSRKPDHWKYR